MRRGVISDSVRRSGNCAVTTNGSCSVSSAVPIWMSTFPSNPNSFGHGLMRASDAGTQASRCRSERILSAERMMHKSWCAPHCAPFKLKIDRALRREILILATCEILLVPVCDSLGNVVSGMFNCRSTAEARRKLTGGSWELMMRCCSQMLPSRLHAYNFLLYIWQACAKFYACIYGYCCDAQWLGRMSYFTKIGELPV